MSNQLRNQVEVHKYTYEQRHQMEVHKYTNEQPIKEPSGGA